MILQAWKPLLAASAAVGTVVFTALLDCNPQLYLYDRFLYDSQTAFHNKSIWLIGASSGIGEEMALQLAQAKCQRLILSSRNTEKLTILSQQCKQYLPPSSQCDCVPVDVADPTSLKQAMGKVNPESLDMVVLNAGAGQLCPAVETEPNVIQQIMLTNALWPMVFMPILLNRHHHDKANSENNNRQTPTILVTSSIAALLPVPLSSCYAAAKAALGHYLASLAAERPDLKIDICCPGPVDTAFHSNHVATGTRDNMENKQVATPKAISPSRLKMPVERCARLMLASAALGGISPPDSKKEKDKLRNRGLSEFWIAQQPVLTTLYLNHWFPTWMNRHVFSRIGTKRVEMWREGLDLYDPASWTK